MTLAPHRHRRRAAVMVACVASVLVLGLPVATPAEQPPFTPTPTPNPSARPTPSIVRCGDVDGTGAVGVTDGVLVLRAAAGLASPCTPATCDADDSGDVTVSDGVRVLRVAAGLNVGFPLELDCPAFTVAEDLSDFTHFDFARQAALGFCPPTGAVFRAAIDRLDANRYRARLSVLEEGRPGEPGCIVSEDRCFVEAPLPDRILSATEADVVRTAFAAVRFAWSPEPICVQGGHFDPCMIDVATWDDLRATDYGCDVPRLLADQVDELTALLDALR